MRITGIHEKDGPWYLTEHSVIQDKDDSDDIGKSDWADWSHTGDLLFALEGRMYRARCERGNLVPLVEAEEIADFSELQFQNVPPSEFAQHWPQK